MSALILAGAFDSVLGLILAVALLVFLFVALVLPDRF